MDRAYPQVHEPGQRYKVPRNLYLAADQRLRFLTTVSEKSEGVSTTFNLFPLSAPYGGDVGDVYGMLTRIIRPKQDDKARPAAAVAVAGLAAYGGRHRRAVVLIPSSQPRDPEELSPEHVRRYLGRLGVPLYVWEPRSRVGRNAEAWGGGGARSRRSKSSARRLPRSMKSSNASGSSGSTGATCLRTWSSRRR